MPKMSAICRYTSILHHDFYNGYQFLWRNLYKVLPRTRAYEWYKASEDGGQLVDLFLDNFR